MTQISEQPAKAILSRFGTPMWTLLISVAAAFSRGYGQYVDLNLTRLEKGNPKDGDGLTNVPYTRGI